LNDRVSIISQKNEAIFYQNTVSIKYNNHQPCFLRALVSADRAIPRQRGESGEDAFAPLLFIGYY
jgi:hypothetical protein